MKTSELFQKIEDAINKEDLAELEALESEFIEGVESNYAFEPSIRFRSISDSDQEGDVAMSAANGISRAKRNIKYRIRKSGGYNGPIIVSEGDSWFQYPILLKDVIDNLSETFAIRSLGAAGDTLNNMLNEKEYIKALDKESADFLLVSASGNDALGGGDLKKLLNTYEIGMEIDDVIRTNDFAEILQKIEQGYEEIIKDSLNINANLNILFHGYDSVIPRPDGKWLGKPMAQRGIPRSMQSKVVATLIDGLNQRLSLLEGRYPDRVRHVDCRGQVGSTTQSWYDELHPRNAGYARVAGLFEQQILDMLHASPSVAVGISPPLQHHAPNEEVWTIGDEILAEAEEEALIDASPRLRSSRVNVETTLQFQIDQEIIRDFEELRRQKSDLDDDKRRRARRQMVPVDDDKGFERILGISNLFPINYLSRGANKSRAVAKIQLFFGGEIPAGSGSGFLVAPGLLLTNNHVINTRDVARRAKAILDFQEDDLFDSVPTKSFRITDDVFFTSDRNELDFTFVSVEKLNSRDQDLSQFGHLTLVEESGKALKDESVSIIQHPKGRMKSIALRDSRIMGVKGDFIYYSTDTEPGSSGSPVLNDQWLPVALHHRSVPHPTESGKWIANRGIRISRIFVKLRTAAENGDVNANRILKLLGATPSETPQIIVPDERPLRPREADFIPSITASPTIANSAAFEEASFSRNRWDGIDGYDPGFLEQNIPLPLPPQNESVREVNGRPDLPYLHFSVVMHETRRLPMVTACNVDGARLKRLGRRGSWRLDPRIPNNAQVDNEAYRRNEYDRGHMVRRLAPMWGSNEDARFAEADTFHYTVATPQHARLNQKAWLELEDYLLDWAEENNTRMSIFTGPIFRPDDPVYRSIVQIPADYWKVAIADTNTGLRAVSYLHTQKNLIPTVDEAFGDYKTHRIPTHIISDLSGLNLEAVLLHDVSSEPFENLSGIKIVSGPEDIGFR